MILGDENDPFNLFLSNFKSTATMVTPKFRFNLLKILNKVMFGKECAGNILAVMFI